MSVEIEMLAEQLAKSNKLVSLKSGAIFNAMESAAYDSKDLDVIVSKLSDKLNFEISLLKNKINPLAKELITVINNDMERSTMDNESLKFKVTEYNIPEYINIVLDGKSNNSTNMNVPDFNFAIPFETGDIHFFLKPHPSEASSALLEVVDKYSESDLITIWNNLFINNTNRNIFFQSINSDILFNIDKLIIANVFVNNLKDQRPTNVDSSDRDYRNAMNALATYINNLFKKYMEKLEQSRKLKVVVLKINAPYEVIVDAEMMSDLYTSNYSPEVLLGLLLKNNITLLDRTLGNIKANMGEYVKAWNEMLHSETILGSNNKILMLKTAYSIAIKRLYEEMIPDSLLELVTVDRSTCQNEFMEILKGFKNSEILDIDKCIITLIGKVIFKSTYYYVFNEYIEEFIKMDSSLEYNEAAKFATVKILSNYLLQQIDIDRV